MKFVCQKINWAKIQNQVDVINQPGQGKEKQPIAPKLLLIETKFPIARNMKKGHKEMSSIYLVDIDVELYFEPKLKRKQEN